MVRCMAIATKPQNTPRCASNIYANIQGKAIDKKDLGDLHQVVTGTGGSS